ncbi:hypothetical protein JWS13_04335 (plasmid) [Rhodococcus pseudokoreensis]|uniref:DUF4134 domain-containing protein n=1 Tax=Rhodococcus pseudokoreensis TaxID=2811421 RepID=A0A974VYH9_9NOCA|nr:hypothetical protein [Rhodococcus pseudokoreensis]QSE87943.1 hypothetical protein JWS13_04335 [Rhodococcus pseudokoreensis]
MNPIDHRILSDRKAHFPMGNTLNDNRTIFIRGRWARRLTAIALVALATTLIGGGPAQAATTILAAENPFDGVTPDFSIFGLQFTQAWQKVLGGFWGIGFVVTAFSAIRATVALARAKKGGYGVQVAEQTEDAKWAGIAFGALSMLGVIVGGVITVFQ